MIRMGGTVDISYGSNLRDTIDVIENCFMLDERWMQHHSGDCAIIKLMGVVCMQCV